MHSASGIPPTAKEANLVTDSKKTTLVLSTSVKRCVMLSQFTLGGRLRGPVITAADCTVTYVLHFICFTEGFSY